MAHECNCKHSHIAKQLTTAIEANDRAALDAALQKVEDEGLWECLTTTPGGPQFDSFEAVKQYAEVKLLECHGAGAAR